MQRQNSLSGSRRAWSVLAVLSLLFAFAWLMQGATDNEKAHYALIKALGSGTAVVDQTRYETGDWVTIDTRRWRGHYYSNKPPGLAFLAVGPYVALREVGVSTTGDPRRMVWALGLVVNVLPAMLIVLLTGWLAGRLEPGLGIPVAVTVGLGTLVLPFATVMHSHVLSACLILAAFALLWFERDGPRRLWLLASAGVLAGYALTTDYPNAVAGVVLGAYAVSRAPHLRRALAYGGGFLAGVAPLLIYQWAVFGSTSHITYVGERRRGGDVPSAADVAANGVPSVRVLLETLFARTGFFTMAPVLLCGVLGTALLYRRGRRAESLVIAAIAGTLVLYNASFGSEFDAYAAGERYLVSIVPLLAVPLALSLRRYPVTTAGLGLVSALLMLGLTSSHVHTGENADWFAEIGNRSFPPTVLSLIGITGWYAVLPFFVLAGVAFAFAVAASSAVRWSQRETAFAGIAILAWAAVAVSAPTLPAYGGDSDRLGSWVPLAVVLAIVTALVVGSRVLRGRPRLPAPPQHASANRAAQ